MKFLSNLFPTILSIVLILALIVGNVNSLKCYKCSDCEDSRAEEQTCDSTMNTCMKLTAGENIAKSCFRKEFCSLSKVQDFFGDAVDKIKEFFGSSPSRTKTPDAISCCETDYCNGASIPGSASSFLSVLVFLGVYLVYPLE